MDTHRLRALAPAAAAALAVAVGCAALFLAAGGGVEAAVRARQALTFAVIAESLAALLAPLFGAERAAAGSWRSGALAAARPALLVSAAALPGELLLALLFDRGALVALAAAKLVCLAAGLAAAGLVLALARLTRRPLAAAAAAGALALLLALQPFYTLPAVEALRGRRRAQAALAAAGFRAPPLAAANAFARSLPGGWRYAPHTSGRLYNVWWVGAEHPESIPPAGRQIAEYLLAGLALAALGALRRPAAGRPAAPAGGTEK